MRSNITQVARKAGVSIATVSRVMNGIPKVKSDTKRRVLSIAHKLKYTPNAAARGLIMQRTESIGLLLPDLYGEFFSEVIRGADQSAQQFKYHLLLSSSHNNREDIASALHVMRGRVDGIIIMSPHIDAHTLESNLPKSLPVVLLNCSVDGEQCDSINVDNFHGAYQVVQHLLSHGHKRIAIIKGTAKNLDAEQRLQGYRKALKEADAEISADLELEGDFTEQAGQAAIAKLLNLHPRPTAVFACNDSIAIGAISALRGSGMTVPREIAVAGFDDIPVAQYIKPALTTVRVGINELGVIAMRTLIGAIEDKETHAKRQMIIPATLVIRESCGCAA